MSSFDWKYETVIYREMAKARRRVTNVHAHAAQNLHPPLLRLIIPTIDDVAGHLPPGSPLGEREYADLKGPPRRRQPAQGGDAAWRLGGRKLQSLGG